MHGDYVWRALNPGILFACFGKASATEIAGKRARETVRLVQRGVPNTRPADPASRRFGHSLD